MTKIFEDLVRGGIASILKLVTDKQQENVELDFKSKRDPGTPIYETADKNHLGETLSAFANSMGGVLIWGIDARKDDEGIDCACATKPIVNIDRFKSDMQRLATEALSPRHEGIRVEAIAIPGDGSGFLLVDVQRSERRPHQNQFDKRYYKRVGDSSYRMEHYDVEDAFKRITSPSLEPRYHVVFGGSKQSQSVRTNHCAVHISLLNTSAALAKHPYLILAVNRNFVDFDFQGGLRGRWQDRQAHFEGGADIVIHPEVARDAARIMFDVPAYQNDGKWVFGPEATLPKSIFYKCGAEHARQTEGTITISPEEFLPACPGCVLT